MPKNKVFISNLNNFFHILEHPAFALLKTIY